MSKISGTVIGAKSLEELKNMIDGFKINTKPLTLFCPEGSCIVETYKGFPIRRWPDGTRYDTAHEIS